MGQSIVLSTGNAKLLKTSRFAYKVMGFGIPADYDFDGGNTCPGAKACRSICYAKAGAYRFSNVIKSRLSNLEASQSDGFVEAMCDSILHHRTFNTVRIHDSGDFYSQQYYDKWCEIARNMPSHIFYAYTKALKLDLWSNKPSNLMIVQSLGGRFDRCVDLSKPHSRIFSSNEARVEAGYIDGNASDIPAIEGEVRIGLVYHGVKKLTLAQAKYFG